MLQSKTRDANVIINVVCQPPLTGAPDTLISGPGLQSRSWAANWRSKCCTLVWLAANTLVSFATIASICTLITSWACPDPCKADAQDVCSGAAAVQHTCTSMQVGNNRMQRTRPPILNFGTSTTAHIPAATTQVPQSTSLPILLGGFFMTQHMRWATVKAYWPAEAELSVGLCGVPGRLMLRLNFPKPQVLWLGSANEMGLMI